MLNSIIQRTRKITNPKVKKSDNRNPGIEERIRRDEEEKENVVERDGIGWKWVKQ